MSMLHTVNKSPFERNSLQSCLRVATEGSAVLLIEDGVYGAMAGTEGARALGDAMPGVAVYALEPDLKARGIDTDRVLEGVELGDCPGFVALAAKHDNVQSWL